MVSRVGKGRELEGRECTWQLRLTLTDANSLLNWNENKAFKWDKADMGKLATGLTAKTMVPWMTLVLIDLHPYYKTGSPG